MMNKVEQHLRKLATYPRGASAISDPAERQVREIGRVRPADGASSWASPEGEAATCRGRNLLAAIDKLSKEQMEVLYRDIADEDRHGAVWKCERFIAALADA